MSGLFCADIRPDNVFPSPDFLLVALRYSSFIYDHGFNAFEWRPSRLGKVSDDPPIGSLRCFLFQDSKVWTFTPPKTSKEPETTPLEKEKETSNQTTDF